MTTSVPLPRLRRDHLRRTARSARWLTIASAAAWLLLVAALVAGGGIMHSATMHSMPAGHHTAETLDVDLRWGAVWIVMIVAMMWPLWERPVASIHRSGWRQWRSINGGVFVATLTVMWVAFGVATRLLLAMIPLPRAATLWPLLGLGAAVVLSRSMRRSRILRECWQLGATAPMGARAISSAAHNGARAWPRCALLCGPVMASMAVSHQPSLLIGGTASLWWEQRNAHTWQSGVPTLILTITMLVFIAGY